MSIGYGFVINSSDKGYICLIDYCFIRFFIEREVYENYRKIVF